MTEGDEEQRRYLAANAGLAGLEIVEATDTERVVRVFQRDGFVVVPDVLGPEHLETVRGGVLEVVDEIVQLDDERAGNRGPNRYSFGAASSTGSMLHRPEWQMLLENETVADLVGAVFGSDDFMLRASSGDFCLPGATGYQPLHADMGDWTSSKATPFSSFSDPRGFLTTRDLPCPYVCVNFLLFDQTALNGPTRQIPGSQHSRAPIPNLTEEPEWMRLSTVNPASAGSVQIRDVRAWHGGTPNLSDEVRAIPNLEFYAPWFREPVRTGIGRVDWEQLSERARHMSRFHVADSSEEVNVEYNVTPLPKRLRSSRTTDG